MLSHAQATEVAKRFNPPMGRRYWFSDDGSLLSRAETHRAVAAQKGEIYACRRQASGGAVQVARVTAEDIAAFADADVVEPAFGVPW